MKKNYILSLVTGLGLFLGVSQANAILFYDIDKIYANLDAAGESTWTQYFDITGTGSGKGFVPGYHQADNAKVTFWLFDVAVGRTETVAFNIDNELWVQDQTIETRTFTYTSTFGVDILTSINEDGVVSYSVQALEGSFTLNKAMLEVNASVRSQPVPDGGSTLILLSSAMIGLGFVARRFGRK